MSPYTQQKIARSAKIFIIILFTTMMVLTYFLCDIDTVKEYSWLHGIWHGLCFVFNWILSIFITNRVFIATNYTSAYYIFWWIFTIICTIVWVRNITNLVKRD